MKSRYHVEPTIALPQGVHVCTGGVRFSVWAPEASRVELCLFSAKERLLGAFELYKTDGEYWAGFLKGAQIGQHYLYRVFGEYDEPQGLLFDAERFLMDPYARELSQPLFWDQVRYANKDAKFIPKCVVVNPTFDWQGVEAPCIPLEKTILYELHVKGFTKLHPALPDRLKGTYLGLCHPSVIAHFIELGITSVQLMPVAAFTSESRLQDLQLINYWGYNPICFMAPEPRYACKHAVDEFKTMVRELHRAGIEVILDVVLNHTAEGGYGGPVLSFKGFANRQYYAFERDDNQIYYDRYLNVTGCGNTVNVEHSHVLHVILDSLRYWVSEMHVDGFRFDLAVTLARECQMFNPFAAFFKAVHQDPILKHTKLIAEPWDIGSGGYRLGQFPRRWLELNDSFRDRVRSFWRGDANCLADFATRFVGSQDMFPDLFRNPLSSVNYVCYHDGFTLEDLVSYEQRHNEANGEDNRDGHDHNISANYGVEGPTGDVSILALRQQQKRNFIATVILARGVPHFLAGDEMGRTQHGNNNAYCQDNEISWVNWDLNEQDKKLLAFTREVIAQRQKSTLSTTPSLSDTHRQDQHIHWYHPDGHLLTEGEWHHEHAQALLLDIATEQARWLILLNASMYDIQFRLPQLDETSTWMMCFDTGINNGLPFLPDDIKQHVAVGRALSFKLLEKVKQ